MPESDEISTNINSTPNSYEILDDPLYFSTSDQPMLQLVGYLFDGRNFLQWKRDVYLALVAKNKEGFIDGSTKTPAKTDKKYRPWVRCDLLVMKWIMNSIVKEINDTLVYVTTSKQLWTEILDRYGHTNGVEIYQLNKELGGIYQEFDSLVDTVLQKVLQLLSEKSNSSHCISNFSEGSLLMDSGNVADIILQKLGSLPEISSNCCIYLVPENLRSVNEDAYRPLLVSIGPVYAKDRRLYGMQNQKLRYLKSFLQRNPAHSIQQYINVVRGWEGSASQCYVETINLPPSATFAEMLLVDAVFIIELFSRNCFTEYIDENDRIFNKPRMLIEVIRDIRLEENQVPFFILKGLYELAFGASPQNKHLSFLDVTYRFLMGRNDAVPQRLVLVDFLRICHLPSALRIQFPKNNSHFEFTLSAAELSEAGVKFVASKSENLLDIRFVKGVLEIPRIKVTDDTETLFRNIMVFEQCHYYYDSYIIDYFALLDSLINTPKDVEILSQRGIIENWLGNNEEVANLFSKIFKQTRLKDPNFYYSGICRDLNAYASSSWHRWRAILKHDYFSHPWAAISVFYAIVILILTVLQVITGFK